MDSNENPTTAAETPKQPVSIPIKDESSEQTAPAEQSNEAETQAPEVKADDAPQESAASTAEDTQQKAEEPKAEEPEPEAPFDPTEPIIIEPTSQEEPATEQTTQAAPAAAESTTNDGAVVAEPPVKVEESAAVENNSPAEQMDEPKASVTPDETENTPDSINRELQAAPDMPVVEAAVSQSVAPEAAGQGTADQMAHSNSDTTTQNAASDLHGPAMVGVAASEMRKQHPHRNNRKLAALVVVLVAVLLAGIITYVYLSATNNTQEAANSTIPTASDTETSTEAEQVEPATATDVDATEKEIDEAINSLDDAADFTESDLSDTTLGL